MIDSLANALGMGAAEPAFWMPLLFMVLLYAIVMAGTMLDGFDIGVGCLALYAPRSLRSRMLSLLSPWRDANEFWLFLGLGLFLVAFPGAWSYVMGKLYVPLAMLGLGVALRSISFEMRVRAPEQQRPAWLLGFGIGSLLTALAHGALLAQVVVSYETEAGYWWFTALVAVCAVAAYSLLGAAWLIMREAGELRARAVMWGRKSVRWFAVGVVAVFVTLVFSNSGVFLKWSALPNWTRLVLLWGGLLFSFVSIEMCLQRMINSSFRTTALPFMLVLIIFLVMLGGLGYSFFPYIVLDNITLWDAAAPVGVLRPALVGTLVALPVALVFNIWVYWRMFGLSIAPQPPAFKG
jgi:cytochrome d ubiquinol oxidase subunit II